MFSLPSRRLPYNLFYSYTFTFNVVLFLLLLPAKRNIIDDGDNAGGKEACCKNIMAAADDEAEAKLRAIFISDLKRLLTHNQVFYNSYGYKDEEVDYAFHEAIIAADVIYVRPDIFTAKIKNINYHVHEALKKAKEEEEQKSAMTADGVPVFFVDKHLLLLGMMRGIVRFPE